MLRDHLRSFWRGVVNNKLTTCINVGGLALGLAVFFALTFYVQREFSWDAQWEDAERLYTLRGTAEDQSGRLQFTTNTAPYLIGTILQSRNPDAFTAYAGVFSLTATLVVEGEEYPGRPIFYAEPALLDLLQLETREGNLADAFSDPHAMAVAEDVATDLFGAQSPLGKTLTVRTPIGEPTDYVIKATYKVPEPSTFSNMRFLALLDPAALPVKDLSLEAWRTGAGLPRPLSITHYFKLKAGIDARAIKNDLREFMDTNGILDEGVTVTHFALLPLRDKHFLPTPPASTNNDDLRSRLRVYLMVGTLVLLISGCNFVTLATLRSVDRMREIGIRKTVGGEAVQLMRQYLFDVFCQALAAALLAIALLELALPVLRTQLDFPLEFELLSWRKFAECLGIVTLFTLVSGLYPAFLMARGKPAALLRQSSDGVVTHGNTLRKLLVGIQFVIVIVLLLGSGVTRQQIDYTRSRDRGYSLEDVMAMRLDPRLYERMPAVVAAFNRVQGVRGAGLGNVSPGAAVTTATNHLVATAEDGSRREAALPISVVGSGYFDVMSVPILAGREFSPEVEGARVGAAPISAETIMLNLSATRALGFSSPDLAIDQLITMEADGPNGQPRVVEMRVVGVVADTQFTSVMQPPVAQWYAFAPSRSPFLAIRFEPDADRDRVLSELNSVWGSIVEDYPFQLLSPELLESRQLAREEFEAKVVIGSAMLALAIALMGLYGLVEATVAKRVKEIGVRKVMGASSNAISSLLIWQFSKPIVIANVVAWPLGFWAISRWLLRFPYQLDTAAIAWSALAASIAALLIAWLTIGLRAMRAASAKPVSALRYE